MNKSEYPKITFGIIVLNGEPFTRYCLKSLYPFAHEIIVVEGGHEDARSVCTPDGHSVDGTLEALRNFKANEDPENKVTIVTKDGFWPKMDEYGRCRTPQSRAYAERATGDYLWQIDIDEFYRAEDMVRILEMLRNDPEITAVTFPTYTFWGDINYISDSWALRRGAVYYHRLFKWGKGYRYQTHEPPTVTDENGTDLRTKKWISGPEMKQKGLFMYHYSLLFPWQVEQKVKVYKDEKPEICAELEDWAENNFFSLKNRFRVHNLYQLPGWLERFKGTHPEQVVRMMKEIRSGMVPFKTRQTDDIETLLNSRMYSIEIVGYKIMEPLEKHFSKVFFQLGRVRRAPRKIFRMLFNGK